MLKRSLLGSIFIFLIAILAACGGTSGDAPADGEVVTIGEMRFAKNNDGFADISVRELAEILEKAQEVTVVNVHIPYAGDIPGTDLSIPYNEIASYTDQLPPKDAPIILYCRSGAMSTQAARTLVSLGYTNVLELDGGMNAWVAAGHKLIKQ